MICMREKPFIGAFPNEHALKKSERTYTKECLGEALSGWGKGPTLNSYLLPSYVVCICCELRFSTVIRKNV